MRFHIKFDSLASYSFDLIDYDLSVYNNIFVYERKYIKGSIRSSKEFIVIKYTNEKIYHASIVTNYIDLNEDLPFEEVESITIKEGY